MKKIMIRSFGKINLSLDVLEKLNNGYHQVEMVMQQIQLHDQVLVRWFPEESQYPTKVEVSTNRAYLPRDERNLAYKAAILMAKECAMPQRGKIRIDIKKEIPVAAGLGGGSSNGAAVLHALNHLWNLGLDVNKLSRLACGLGSDVPFSVMGQAKANPHLGLKQDPLAAHCALATGTGDQLKPLSGLESYLILTKPPISISTREVYMGLDFQKISRRPDTGKLIQALKEKNNSEVQKNMINVLETFTLVKYPIVMHTKNDVQEILKERTVLMSGSGPTIFAVCLSQGEARKAFRQLKQKNKETFWSKTTY